MRTIGYPDTDHMVVLPHTPREDALVRGYEGWLIDRGLTGASLGSARAELIAAPDDGSTERTRPDAAGLLVP